MVIKTESYFISIPIINQKEEKSNTRTYMCVKHIPDCIIKTEKVINLAIKVAFFFSEWIIPEEKRYIHSRI